MLPSTPPDPPQPLPALTARRCPPGTRPTRGRSRRAERRPPGTATPSLAGALATLRRGTSSTSAPRPGPGREVFGNLATATRVAILVPGSDTSLATFGSRGAASPGGGARGARCRGARLDPGARLAIIAWLGYPTPAMLSPAVHDLGRRRAGRPGAAAAGDRLARHGDQVALLCHSYGSVVCGLAAPHLPVTDIAVYGSPGMDASSVARWTPPPGCGRAGRAGDWIRDVPHVRLLGLGFGPDPMSPGVRRPDVRLRQRRAQQLLQPGRGLAAQPGLHRAR